MWNLPPPPGFQGLHPDKPLTVYRRHLPHWRQDGASYFVTFRLADSLPQSKLDELASIREAWERRHLPCGKLFRRTAFPSRPSHPRQGTAQESRPTELDAALEELTRALQDRVERWLDEGMGRCVLGQAVLAAWVTRALHHFDDDRYELGGYVVMPNHVHVIVRPLLWERYPLEELVGSWKKYSSRRIQRELQEHGNLWQDESYDRIIRDGEHLWRVVQYLGSNPERAGLCSGALSVMDQAAMG